jgi:hypothetical protein
MSFIAPFPLLSRVKITAPHEGVIQTVVAEITGRRPTQDGGWLYDVLLPAESVTRHDDEYGLRDRRTLADQEPRFLEFIGPPLREITFPAEIRYPTDRVMGWPLNIGVAA